MFKKSEMKIVATIMAIIGTLFAGTLFLIYFTSYNDLVKQNTEMLEKYAELYWENGNPEDRKINKSDSSKVTLDMDSSRTYELTNFFSIEIDEDGDVISTDNEDETDMTDSELIKLCDYFIEQGKNKGVYDNWIYIIQENDGNTLIALMDNTVLTDNILTLFDYSILFGVLSLIILFFVSSYIVHRILRPLEEYYNKQKQFISDAGHELKTPIAVMKANIEINEREFGRNKWIDNVKGVNSQMGDLINQLLELARIDSITTKKSLIDFSKIVKRGALPFEGIAFELNKKMEIEVENDIYINGNEEEINNLITILLDNAFEYSIGEKTIMVFLRKERHMAVLEVVNEGEEIPEEQRKELFNRFYRKDNSRNREKGHYGLGLSIAKAIVTAHKGKIFVNCKQNLVIFSVNIPVNNNKTNRK